MGGLGSGGHAAAGVKPKSDAEHFLNGTKSRRHGVKPLTLPPVQVFDPPSSLNAAEVEVWAELAPAAFQARTLTPATVRAFVLLIRNVLLEQAQRADGEQAGGANHRGILQRVETGLTAFGLRPLGKPMVTDMPAPEDPFAQFDRGVQ